MGDESQKGAHKSPGGKMSDEERRKLIEKMDSDLDAFIKDRTKARQIQREAEGPQKEQTLDELVAELKSHPAFMTEFDPSAEMSPALEGLQKLKYESDSANYNAENYKDDGNHNFKMKKYRWACDSYTQGIREKPDNRELNAILYSNRAAAQFHLGNNRSAFNDTILARKFKPDHMKAIFKGAQCCVELKMFDTAIKWCDDSLLFDSADTKTLELRAKAEKLKREDERDKRKDKARERKQQQAEDTLLQVIQARGVQVSGSLDTPHPSGAKVHVDDSNQLNWPVLLVYPEHGQTDFIRAFNENSRFVDHLDAMFGHQVEPAPWDLDKKYTPERIDIYFHDEANDKIQAVDKNETLKDTLRHPRFVVHGGTPTFILMVTGSKFTESYLTKHKS